jgi:hypothetical protein
MCLEIPMRPKRLPDMSRPPMFREQLNRLEILNVICRGEFVSTGKRTKKQEQHRPGLKNMYRTVAVFL